MLAEPVDLGELDNHFLEVKRQSLKEKYSETFKNLNNYLASTDDKLSAIISKVENEVLSKVNLLDKGEHAVQDMRVGFKEFIFNFAKNPGHVGLDIGFPIWQERSGQVRNGSIAFIAGSTGQGKSLLALNMFAKAARKGLPVLYLDSELSKQDQWLRIAAMLTKTPSEYVETGLWAMSDLEIRQHGITDPDKISEIMTYGKRLQDPRLWDMIDRMPIHHQSISGLSVLEVVPHIRRWLLTHVKPDRETRAAQCLIVYDYIKLALTREVSSGALAEWQQNGLHMAALHDLVKKYNVPMVAFGQTNNEMDDGLKCVAGGKRISENVDSVSYWKRKSEQERAISGNGTHMMKLFKVRHGKALWGSHINFDANLAYGEFIELDIGSTQPPPTNDNAEDDDND
jgi:replicative DNA helicase